MHVTTLAQGSLLKKTPLILPNNTKHFLPIILCDQINKNFSSH